MKTSKSKPPRAASPAPHFQVWYLAGFAALVILLWAYGPTLHTGFLFDDTRQQFATLFASRPLLGWIGPVRPVLMFTYFLNTRISLQDTTSYHVFNLVIHALAALFIFPVLRRLLEWAGIAELERTPWAVFGAVLFLLHPLQTESVAYISGRSDALSGMLAIASFGLYVNRPAAAITWGRAAAVLALFAAASLAKEQAIVLPALFLLTDLWWNPESLVRATRANWRLYAILPAGAVAGLAIFWKSILGIGTGGSAGFAMKDFTWYQYLFTQFRVVFVYMANFVLPANLCLDWDFPISHTILEHGAVVWLVVLLALVAAAWRCRRTFGLAGYGFLVFLVLLSPTSSVLPIQDPIADRRMYFPILGLILVAIDLLRRLKVSPKALAAGCGALLLAASAVTHARAEVWSAALPLWQDTVRQSPNKFRAHFQLAYVYLEQGRNDLALPEFERCAQLKAPTADLLVDWGLAYDAMNQPDKAFEKIRQALAVERSAHVYTQLGYLHAKRSAWTEAMEAFETAQKLDPSFAFTYMYQGQVYLATNQIDRAIAQFQRALDLDPTLDLARQGLTMALQRQAAHR